MFVYEVQTNQHNTLGMTYDKSDILVDADYAQLHIIDNYGQQIVAFFNSSTIEIFEEINYNYLALKNDSSMLQELIKKCEGLTIQTDSAGQQVDAAKELEVVNIQANSLLDS